MLMAANNLESTTGRYRHVLPLLGHEQRTDRWTSLADNVSRLQGVCETLRSTDGPFTSQCTCNVNGIEKIVMQRKYSTLKQDMCWAFVSGTRYRP